MEYEQTGLPKSLFKIHQSCLTHPKYKVFWEMHLVHLLFYGGILNVVAFLALEILPYSSDSFMMLSFRLGAMILAIVWLWHTFRHYPEKDHGEVSPFLLRTRFLIYFGGLVFVFLPIEYLGSSPELPFAINTLMFFYLSILISLMKLTTGKTLVIGVLLGFLTLIPMVLWIAILSSSALQDSWSVFFGLPISLLPYIGLFYGKKESPTVGVIASLIIPTAIWQIMGMLHGVLSESSRVDGGSLGAILMIVITLVYSIYIWLIPKLQMSIIRGSVIPVKENISIKK